jgi:hypothetical protein
MPEVWRQTWTGQLATLRGEPIAQPLLDGKIAAKELSAHINQTGQRDAAAVDLWLLQTETLPVRARGKDLTELLLSTLQAITDGALGLFAGGGSIESAQRRIFGGHNRLDVSDPTAVSPSDEQ